MVSMYMQGVSDHQSYTNTGTHSLTIEMLLFLVGLHVHHVRIDPVVVRWALAISRVGYGIPFGF